MPSTPEAVDQFLAAKNPLRARQGRQRGRRRHLGIGDVPKLDSFFIGAEVFVTFLVRNGVWWIREAQGTQDGFLKNLDEGRRRILSG